MTEYYIRLQGILGAGSHKAIKAIEYFGGVENIFMASDKERAAFGIFTSNELKRFNKLTDAGVKDIIADCIKCKIDIITLKDKRYPYCLSVIENPPLVLYVKGTMPDFDSLPVICIVGPRKVTEYGKKAAYSLSRRLAAAGFIVVSGGAVGCDYYAHLGALKGGGKTALVMGCGIESSYLPKNEALRNHVKDNGCLISEYPPRIKTSKYSFLVRNRIMSALSVATVVIEAAEISGALNTASHALEQGRDIFVIPGNPTDKQYIGSNALLREGAKPLLDVSDIFNEYILRFPDKIDVKKAYGIPKNTASPVNKKDEKTEIHKKLSIENLSNEAKIVYNCINKHKFYPEEIKDTGLTSSDVLSALTELEIEMVIRSLPGGCYEITD